MPAPTIDQLTLADDPAAWRAMGFAAADGACLLRQVRLSFTGPARVKGLVAWSLRDIASAELDGLPTSLSDRPVPAQAPAHPNGVVGIDHVVAVSPSLDRSIGALQSAGLDLRRVREEPTPAGAPRQAFFRLGQEILELVQEPAEVLERSGGADRPTTFWGLALLSADLERTVKAFGPHVGSVRPAVQPGRLIATVKRSAGLAVPLALISADEQNRAQR